MNGDTKEKGKGKAPSPGEQDINPIGDEEEYGTGTPVGGGKFTPFIIPLILAVVVSWGMISFMAAPKGAYRNDITRLETDLVAAREVDSKIDTQISDLVTSINNQVDEKIATMEGTVNNLNNSLTNYATKSSVDALTNLPTVISDKVDRLSTSLTDTIDDQLSEQDEKIAELEERLTELESPVNSDLDPEDAVEVDVRYYGTHIETILPGNSSSISIPIKLRLDNQLATNIQDVVLSAEIILRTTSGTLVVSNTSLVGEIVWYPYSKNSFESWSDIGIKASSRETYQLTFSASVANHELAPGNITSIMVSMKFECEDFEVAK